MSSDLQALPAQTTPSSRPRVAILWSDPDSHALALALDRLIAATFEGRIATWLSTRELGPPEWRSDLQRVMQGAVATVATIVAVGPASVDRDAKAPGWPRILYQAGACYRDGATYVIGCAVDRAALSGTPLESMRVWDALELAHVKAVLGAIGTPVGMPAAALERPFADAWLEFVDAVGRLEGGAEERAAGAAAAAADRIQREEAGRKWARVRRVARGGAIGAALLVISLAPWAWALWPAPDPPAPCSIGTGPEQAQCQWEWLVAAAAARGAIPAPQLAARLAARPFAVVALTPTCDPQAVAHDVRLVAQGAVGDGWTLPILQATPSQAQSPGTPAAIGVASAGPAGSRVDVLERGRCVALAHGALQVRHIGTLGDALCPTLDTLRQAFGASPGVVDQLAGFLASSGVDTAGPLRPQIAQWQASCGLP